MFDNYKDCLFKVIIMRRTQKKSISSNDDKRLQIFDRVTTHLYGINAFKVCESEMMKVKDLFLRKL